MTVQKLPTPALLLDSSLFASNIRKMAAHVAASGKKLRPHAKAHKSVDVAKCQVAAGAVGVCVATVPEAELMVRAGIPGVLLTSPLADYGKMARIASLAAVGADLMVVVDHRQQVEMYSQVAVRAGTNLNVLVDIDVGDHRTGILPGEPALQLAKAIVDADGLQFSGIQASSVRASHLPHSEERAQFSAQAWRCASETRDLFGQYGVEAAILTGGSTGTCLSDASLPDVTEIQAGSYVFMDGAYSRIGGVEFSHALSVLATVISTTHSDRVTIDAGFKSFSTDRTFGPDPIDLDGVRYEWAGDEFGYLHLDSASPPVQMGDRVRFIPPHCDPTVNLYDRIHVCDGEQVVDVWPVMDRLTR